MWRTPRSCAADSSWAWPVCCRSQQIGWPPKPLDVLVQTGHELRGIVWIVVQDARLRDDPALCFSQPHHPAKLRRLAGLALADDGSTWLEQADQFLPNGTASPWITRRVGWVITCCTGSRKV
jgi:hypothetical protein